MRGIQAARGGAQWLAVDLTMAQMKVVMLLVQAGPVPSRIIGEQLHISPSAVTPLVDRLVSLKLARRKSNPDDRRVIEVMATEKAIALRESLLEAGRSVLTDVLKQVPAGEREAVSRALSILRDSALRVQTRLQGKSHPC